jgi:hypothetical protein
VITTSLEEHKLIHGDVFCVSVCKHDSEFGG